MLRFACCGIVPELLMCSAAGSCENIEGESFSSSPSQQKQPQQQQEQDQQEQQTAGALGAPVAVKKSAIA